MKMLGRRGIAPPFLTSGLDGQWSASRLGRFTSGAHYIGGWVDPKAGLDAVEKIKLTCPWRESNLGRPVRSPSLYRLSYPGSKIFNQYYNWGMQ
jgi:hypothetical protein